MIDTLLTLFKFRGYYLFGIIRECDDIVFGISFTEPDLELKHCCTRDCKLYFWKVCLFLWIEKD